MRTDDIRFLVYDECDRVAGDGGLRVMKHGVEPRIVERTDATTTIEADCYLIDPSEIPEDEMVTVLGLDFDPGPEEVLIDFDC